MTEPRFWNTNFIKIALANLFLALPFYILTIILPIFIKDGLGVPEQHIGIILAMYSLSTVVMRPIAGYLLDNFNRKIVYLLGFTLYTVCMILYPWVTGAVLVGLLRFVHGIGWGSINTSGSTLAIEFVPKHRRGEGIGIYGMSMTIATMIGPLLGTFIYQSTGSFPTVFTISFLISALALALGSTIRVPKSPRKRMPFVFKNIFSSKALPAGILALFIHIPYGFVIGFISLYASSLERANAGIFFFIYALTAFVSRYSAGRLFDKIGPKYLVPMGVVFSSLGFILFALLSSQMGLYIGAIPIGLGFGTLMNATQSMANHGVPSEDRGRANSTYLMLFDIGIGSGIFIFGQIIGYLGYNTAIYTSAIILILSLLVFYFIALPAHNKSTHS